MADLLALSARYIDEGVYEGPQSVNRVIQELSEVADGVAVVESFSHVVALTTDAGLILFDTSAAPFGPAVRDALRSWSSDPVHTIVYTHGHVDHVGGASVFMDEAAAGGRPRPQVVAHEAVPARFARYDRTNGYNAVINARQFGRTGLGMTSDNPTWPREWVQPDATFDREHDLTVGGTEVRLRHARGETDDHCWAELPGIRAVCTGDFFTWVFPNAGNPQKVQRYPDEWAAALRDIAAIGPELLLPAHGLPVAGAERIGRVLGEAATALEALVEQTLALMNEGARLDRILAEVRVPGDLAERPFLRAVYDEPEFVVRNIWRLYGGWYDGNPAHLKPASDGALAAEVAALAGGVERLVARARDLAADGEMRLACHLAEMAALVEVDDPAVHAARAEIYRARRASELSLMSRGIFAAAAAESDRSRD
jgi:alkyl sulfatase BDS1-like metallo-beta-lactamase superfamily hydrolase